LLPVRSRINADGLHTASFNAWLDTAKHSAWEALEHRAQLADRRFLDQPGALEQHGERHTGPFGVADRTEFPLCARRRRHQEHAAVAGAFQRGNARP